jgi:hypothetical protein
LFTEQIGYRDDARKCIARWEAKSMNDAFLEVWQKFADMKAVVNIDGKPYLSLDLAKAAIEVHIKEAIATEREACALIADKIGDSYDYDQGAQIAMAIRLRGPAIDTAAPVDGRMR